MNSYSQDEYDKKIELELKKKELKEKYGAHFSNSLNNSPELEMEWISYIEKFEEQYENAQMITVYEFLGRPAYRTAEELEPELLTAELNNLMEYLNEHNVSLDALCTVDERELYRFITEELFYHEVENIHVEGMMMCFIYEEFHPNAEYDIRSAYDYFFSMTMAKMKNVGGRGYDLLYIDTENYLNSKGEKLEKKKVTKIINTFLASFDHFDIITNEIKQISINENKTKAKLTFAIEFRGCFEKSREFVEFKGTGSFLLRPSKYGGWNIYQINLPGWQL